MKPRPNVLCREDFFLNERHCTQTYLICVPCSATMCGTDEQNLSH